MIDLYAFISSEDAESPAREDANRIALIAMRSILEEKEPFEVSVRGVAVRIDVERGKAADWPSIAAGVDEQRDGPWPARSHLRCKWNGGSTMLTVLADTWGNGHRKYVGFSALAIRDETQTLLWITVSSEIRSAPDDGIVSVRAELSLRKKKIQGEDTNAGTHKIVQLVQSADVPFLTAKRPEAFRVHVPSGRVLPSAKEALRRLAIIALAKQPFLSKATGGKAGVFDPDELEGEVDVGGGQAKQALLPPLPGGVRSDKETLDRLVEWIAAESPSEEVFAQYLLDEFDVDDKALIASSRRLLSTLGLVTHGRGALEISPLGSDYLREKTPQRLFKLLNQHFVGVLEALVAVNATDGTNSEVVTAFRAFATTANLDAAQVNARRNWMLSLQLTERTEGGESLTALGRAVLGEHDEDAGQLEGQLLDGETGPDSEGDDEPGARSAEPPGWQSDRLDLRRAAVEAHLGGLTLPLSLLEQACAALSAGKHLLLVGPPGTGKTELALVLAKTAQSEGYCSGLFTSTASADWTTYETIGGYALRKDSSLEFRSGVFLRALERWQWLLIDEINRADIDKAFGELMTVLSGKGADTPYIGHGDRLISIGPEAHRSHVMPKTFRVIATMNIWDKTSLFRLSYAVQRRFAIIHVGHPDEQTYAQLLHHEATKPWLEPPLVPSVASRLVELFGHEALLAIRPVGPAIPLDMIRYMRRRQAEHLGMAEAIAMFLLPQLEGIEPQKAEPLWALLAAAVASQAEAEPYLRARFLELFPLAHLPKG